MAALIAYFSRAAGNYVNGTIQDLKVGNTEAAATILAGLTGAALFKIEPVVEYSNDYSACLEEAKQDKKRDARPELKTWLENLDGADTIYLGYPNYWNTMPMAVFTFLERYDFTGKTIKPFCTHEGSGLGTSETDIRLLCPGAQVTKGLAILGARVGEAQAALKQWL